MQRFRPSLIWHRPTKSNLTKSNLTRTSQADLNQRKLNPPPSRRNRNQTPGSQKSKPHRNQQIPSVLDNLRKVVDGHP